MLVDSVVFHGVVAILIILAILVVVGFGIVGVFKAITRGATDVAHHASNRGDPR